jgi:hypothetical protein
VTGRDDADEARRHIRRLLLSGDNILKNRDDAGRFARAGERFEEARAIAEEAGLTDALAIIEIRLRDLPA